MNDFYNYKVMPSVVKSEEVTKVCITPKYESLKFREDKEYLVTVIAKEEWDVPLSKDYIIGDFKRISILGNVEDGELSFSYFFKNEQEWVIIINEGDNFEQSFHLYSLNEDLYNRKVFKGDLHIHTNRSDGNEEPAVVAANYRKAGFDFIAITDHHRFEPSIEAKDKISGLETEFKIFTGEEVHNRGKGYFHVVSFNGKYSVNRRLLNDYENVEKEVREQISNLKIPVGVDSLEFSWRKWICDEIRKSGGLAIFPHPYWTFENTYHTQTSMSKAIIQNDLCDVFEIIGGCSPNENNLQTSFYYDQCAKGKRIPIVGSSDSHGTQLPNKFFNYACTLVFSKDTETISQSILELYSVAVETIPNENFRVYGPFRLVKYAIFLMNYYYPMHNELCSHSGSALRDLLITDGTKNLFETLEIKVKNHTSEFFGYYV